MVFASANSSSRGTTSADWFSACVADTAAGECVARRYNIYFGDTPNPGLFMATGPNYGNGTRTWPITSFTTAGAAPPSTTCTDPAATNVGGPLPCTYPPPPPPAGSCATLTLDKTALYVGGPEGNWTITVTAPNATCSWTAVSDAGCLVVKYTIPAVPVGSGAVKMRAMTNAGSKRIGHVVVGGVTYTVTQGSGS